MSFSEVKQFLIGPDKLDEFEILVKEMLPLQKEIAGSMDIKYYSYWQFDTIEHYSDATAWFFRIFEKRLGKLLIMPFDIMCGESIESE